MNDARAVERETGDEAAIHQVDEKGREADFDDVCTESPDERPLALARATHPLHQLAQVASGEDVGKPIPKLAEARLFRNGFAELLAADFAFPRCERIGVETIEVEWLDGIFGRHGRPGKSSSSMI